MADSILRLKVESQEYDQKIRRAAEGIQQYAEKCREAGGTLEHLDDGVLEFVQALGQMDTVANSSRQQLREMSNALTMLTMTYRGLTDEEKASPFGRELANGIKQLTERAGQAQDAMADVQQSIKNASSDTRAFDQLSQGMSVAMAGFQGLTGAGKLLGIEMGNDVEVIARLQAAMAVTNSLTTIQTALQKQSALMQGVQAVQATAAATAQALYAKNTALATAAGAAFNAVAKANPYVLLASAVAAVGVALVGLSKNAKKATEATEVQTDAMKQAQRMADIWKNTMGSTFSSLMTKYDELKRQWQSLASEHSKTEWIKKNQTALHDLGGAVNDIKTAEDFFNNNTDAVVQSFVRRAQAAARVAQLTELYRKQIELLDKKSQASADITADATRQGRSAKGGDIIKDATYRSSKYGKVNAQGQWVFTDAGAKLYSGTDTSSSSTVMKIDVELQANQANIDKVKNQITDEFKDVSVLSGGGGGGGKVSTVKPEEILPVGSVAALSKELQDIQKQQSLTTDTESWKKYQEQIDAVKTSIAAIKGELVKIDIKDISQAVSLSPSGPRDPLASGQKSISNLRKQIQAEINADNIKIDEASLHTLIQTSIQHGIDSLDPQFGILADKIGQGLDVPDEAWEALQAQINERLQAMGIEPIKLNVKTGEDDNSEGNKEKGGKQNPYLHRNEEGKLELKMSDALGGMASGIQNMVGGLEQLGIDIPKGLKDVLGGIQAVTSLLSSIMSIVTVIQAIAGADAIIPFAGGGIVPRFAGGGLIGNAALGMTIPGHSYSGDLLRLPVDGGRGMIGVNSGEVILNQAQAGILESELSGSRMRDINITGVLEGEKILLAVNRYLRRTGQGELVTWV